MSSPTLPGPTPLWKRELRIDWQPMVRTAREHPEAILIGLGVALRVVTYLWNRAMWLDELSLRGNIVDKPVLDFFEPLWNDQLAPLGFLVAERVIATFVSTRNYALRLIPLAAGIASIFLFAQLARRVLPRRPALVALALFALSDDLIYYSSELKPYMIDLAIGLAITLGTVRALGGEPTTRLLTWMAVLLAIAPWFSFASAFVVVGCGLVLVVDAALARRGRIATLWLIVGFAWLADFAIAYRASQALLSLYTTMYRFWDFAFLRIGVPMTTEDLSKTANLLLEVFVNPLNLLCPDGVQLGVILPLGLFLLGIPALTRRSWRVWVLLSGPIAMAMAASAARRYPFHGRLILELTPAFFLTIAAGTEAVARRFPGAGSLVYRTVLIVLLTFPTWDALSNCTSRRIRPFQIHGDLHETVFIDQDLRKKPGGRP